MGHLDLVGKRVMVFHRGKMREGIVERFAPKTSESRKENYWWVKFEDELKGTYYERKLCLEKEFGEGN